MDNHLYHVISVMVVDRISRWNGITEKIVKKGTSFVFPSQRYQDVRHLLPNPKPKLMVGFFSCGKKLVLQTT